MRSARHLKRGYWGYLAGTALTILTGQLLLLWIGAGLARRSYDLPFLLQRNAPEELVMVYLDSKVKANLGEPTGQPLSRRFYTRLVDKLKRDGARLICFDIIFDEPAEDAQIDADFAEAIRRHGRVVLVGDQVTQLQGNVSLKAPLPPTDVLAAAAAGWGVAQLDRPDPDYAIRRIDPGTEDYPAVSWVAASLLGAAVTKDPQNRFVERWLNYPCPPWMFRAVNLDHALDPDGLNPGFFQDKIVVVGARPAIGLPGAAREEWSNPYSLFGERFSSGAELHALSLLNLLRGDWLHRLGRAWEIGFVIFWGLIISFALVSLRPWNAAWVALVSGLLLAGTAAYVQLRHQLWWPWLIPAAAQTSVALFWSLGYQYGVEAWKRRQLRRAFGAYLSPYMADRIAESDFDLSLGGQEVEATVMFTDLEGFTQMSESLPPQEVSQILTTYFNRTTRAILEQDGTIIKYIGDAVMAVWGAPLSDPKHAERAVRAACGMIAAGRQEIAGRHLRTRIGVHTGLVLAGNLGSDSRFDYTLIGNTTNFASRLEGLNKYLGTDILISDATRQPAGHGFKVRPLGRFLVVGTSKAIGIHEVLGTVAQFADDLPWLAAFGRGLECFARRDFDQAESLMKEVLALRGGQDGPASFYLGLIARLRIEPPLEANWCGEVRLTEK